MTNLQNTISLWKNEVINRKKLLQFIEIFQKSSKFDPIKT